MLLEDVARIDSKGRITIPAHIRIAMGINEGDVVRLIADPDAGLIVVAVGEVFESIEVVEFQLDSVEALSRITVAIEAHILLSLRCSAVRRDAIRCRVTIKGGSADRVVDAVKSVGGQVLGVRVDTLASLYGVRALPSAGKTPIDG